MVKTLSCILTAAAAITLAAADGLILQSALDETLDAVGKNGTAVKGQTKKKAPVFTDGLKNKALYLDCDELNFPASGNINMETGTISFWFKPGNWGDQKKLEFLPAFAIDSSNQGSGWKILLFFYRNPHEICPFWQLDISTPGGIKHIQMPVKNYLKRNGWNHLVIVWDKESFTLSFNGIIKKVAAPIQMKGHPRDKIVFFPERFWKAFSQWQTAIDEIKVFDRALTENEIKQLYQEFSN